MDLLRFWPRCHLTGKFCLLSSQDWWLATSTLVVLIASGPSLLVLCLYNWRYSTRHVLHCRTLANRFCALRVGLGRPVINFPLHIGRVFNIHSPIRLMVLVLRAPPTNGLSSLLHSWNESFVDSLHSSNEPSALSNKVGNDKHLFAIPRDNDKTVYSQSSLHRAVAFPAEDGKSSYPLRNDECNGDSRMPSKMPQRTHHPASSSSRLYTHATPFYLNP